MHAFFIRSIPIVVTLLTACSAMADTRYVWQQSPTPTPPFTNWATAATNIQDAVDQSVDGDTVLVAGGVYSTGGRAVYGTMTNRVAVDRAITLLSLMGPEVTIIEGYQVPGTTNGDGAIRCVYLTNGASMCGFTLTNGGTRAAGDTTQRSGGGLWCESMDAYASNCVVTGNSASAYGGGAFDGTLKNCSLAGNSAAWGGGGACLGILHDCTLTGNFTKGRGGGSLDGTLDSCNLTGNSTTDNGGGSYESTLTNCTLSGNSADYHGGGGVRRHVDDLHSDG